jgi:hypothetical protein
MSDLFNPVGRNLGGFTGPTLLTGVVPDPPRNLLGLATGTILKGTVLGKGADGLTAVATDKGTVSVATNAQLPAGSAVTLEVRNAGGDRLQVLILAVEPANSRAAQPHQPGSGAGSATAAAAASSGAVGAAAHKAKAEPTPRSAAPPPIQIAGSSVKAIVVQAPPAASLLPTPDVEVEPFTAPNPPVSVPPDAAQRAQLLAQARLLVEPSVLAGADGPDPLPGGTPKTGITPSPFAPPEPGALPIGGRVLQPDVAARIAALFAAASAAEATPPTSPGTAPPSPGGIPAGAVLQDALTPAHVSSTAVPLANVSPGTMPAEKSAPGAGLPLGGLPQPNIPPANIPTDAMPAGGAPGPAAGPLLAQFLAGTPAAAPAMSLAPAMLPAGSELTLHVVAVLPTKDSALEIAPEAARLTGGAAPLIGKVLGYTRAGHAVIDTPAGALMMQERTRLPVGAQVALVLEPVVTPPAAVTVPPITSPQQALLYLSNGWPALDDLLAVLRGPATGPDDPTTPPPPGVPQTGPKLAAGLAAAITALRGGDVEHLLVPLLAGRKIPDDKEDTVKRLKEEFTQLSDLAKDRPSVDWRALFLPVYDARIGLTQINLYYRHNAGGGEKDKKDQGTRFLVDVNFAALGAFQLDGLIRGKRFDLMIRSRSRLSRNQRQDIIGIFENALEVGGCTGALEFRTVESFPVSPLDELRQSHDDLTA